MSGVIPSEQAWNRVSRSVELTEQLARGQSLQPSIFPPQAMSGSLRPSFYPWRSAANKISCTGGLIHCGGSLADLSSYGEGGCFGVNGLAETAVAANDMVWVELSGNTWTIKTGAAYPTGKLFRLIATIAADGSDIKVVREFWAGGDLHIPALFILPCATDGGAAGGSGGSCSFTYRISTDTIGDVATGLTPLIGRVPGARYTGGQRALVGLSDAYGLFLIKVLDEIIDPGSATVVTSVDFGLQTVTTKNLLVLNAP